MVKIGLQENIVSQRDPPRDLFFCCSLKYGDHGQSLKGHGEMAWDRDRVASVRFILVS